MKKSSKKKSIKNLEISNENLKFVKSIKFFFLIFSRPMFSKVFRKGFNYGGMNFEMEMFLKFNTI
jgi:hypothetical protein